MNRKLLSEKVEKALRGPEYTPTQLTARKLTAWIHWTLENNKGVIAAQAEGSTVSIFFDGGCIKLQCSATDEGSWTIEDTENP